MDTYLFHFRIEQEKPRMGGLITIVETAEDFDQALHNALDRLATELEADEGEGFAAYEDGFFKLGQGASGLLRSEWRSGTTTSTVETSEGKNVESIGTETPDKPVLELDMDDEDDDDDED